MLGLVEAAARPPLFQRAAMISDLLVQKPVGTLPRMATSSAGSAGDHQGLSWCSCAAGAAAAAAPLGCCRCSCGCCWFCCAEGAAAPLGCCWCCCAGAVEAAAPLGCCWCCCGCCSLCCAALLRASAKGPLVGSSSLMLGSGIVFRSALKTLARLAVNVALLAAACCAAYMVCSASLASLHSCGSGSSESEVSWPSSSSWSFSSLPSLS